MKTLYESILDGADDIDKVSKAAQDELTKRDIIRYLDEHSLFYNRYAKYTYEVGKDSKGWYVVITPDSKRPWSTQSNLCFSPRVVSWATEIDTFNDKIKEFRGKSDTFDKFNGTIPYFRIKEVKGDVMFCGNQGWWDITFIDECEQLKLMGMTGKPRKPNERSIDLGNLKCKRIFVFDGFSGIVLMGNPRCNQVLWGGMGESQPPVLKFNAKLEKL